MAKEKETVVVVSKLKDAVKALGLRSGDEWVEAVNEQVHMIIAASANRCKANGRQTLKAEDI